MDNPESTAQLLDHSHDGATRSLRTLRCGGLVSSIAMPGVVADFVESPAAAKMVCGSGGVEGWVDSSYAHFPNAPPSQSPVKTGIQLAKFVTGAGVLALPFAVSL
jgi:hypothetical protein